MNINATLFVQAINFFIAYLLFRFILLKPAYHAIVQEQEDQGRLEGLVAGDKKSLEDTRKKQTARWLACQRYCKKYLPGQINEVELFRGITPKISVHAPSSRELSSMTERISQTIIARVGGADSRD